jgi:hypothetical protein
MSSADLVHRNGFAGRCDVPARTMWGPELILIYNDAYRPFPGPRHPFALGKSAREVYRESWHVVGSLLERQRIQSRAQGLAYSLQPVHRAHRGQNMGRVSTLPAALFQQSQSLRALEQSIEQE